MVVERLTNRYDGRDGKGRIYDKWLWEKEGIQREATIRVRGAKTDPTFFIIDEEYGFVVSDKLLKNVIAEISTEYEKRLVQTWETFVWVRLKREAPDFGRPGRTLIFEFEPVQVGKDASGKPVHREVLFVWSDGTEEGNRHHSSKGNDDDAPIPLRHWKGEIRTKGARGQVESGEPSCPFGYSDGYKTRQNPNGVLLPATPETINALLTFTFQIDQLGNVLQQLLSKKRINETLALIAKGTGPLALPPPPKKEAK